MVIAMVVKVGRAGIQSNDGSERTKRSLTHIALSGSILGEQFFDGPGWQLSPLVSLQTVLRLNGPSRLNHRIRLVKRLHQRIDQLEPLYGAKFAGRFNYFGSRHGFIVTKNLKTHKLRYRSGQFGHRESAARNAPMFE